MKYWWFPYDPLCSLVASFFWKWMIFLTTLMAMVNKTGVSANVTRIKPNTRLTSQLIHVITLKKNPPFLLVTTLKRKKRNGRINDA